MSDHDHPDDDARVAERLSAFGRHPLDRETEERVWGQLRAEGETPRRAGHARWFVAAAVAGVMAGSAGLAAADALPAPVQDVAHRAFGSVGVHVPPGHQRYNDPAVCPGGPYRNHGEYVRSHRDDPNAGASRCGKPARAVDPSKGSGEPANGRGNGPPPRARNGKAEKDHVERPAAAPRNESPPTAPSPASTPTTPSTSTSTTTTTTVTTSDATTDTT